VTAFSAGSHPTGAVNPHALTLLKRHGHDVAALRSKSWDEFALPDAPVMAAVITVCASAAGETCPFWPGAPVTGHWGADDPAAVTGSKAKIEAAFEQAYALLRRRAEALLATRFDTMELPALKQTLDLIGDLA